MCRRSTPWLLSAALLAASVVIAQPAAATLADVYQAFSAPPDDARVMMRWWWFGAAIDSAQIARDLEAMRRAGLGGAEIQPVYPLAVDDPIRGRVNRRFLSDDFLAALGEANEQAAARGLRLDLTLGSGWPFGGPTVGISDAASRLRVDRIVVGPGTPRIARPAMTNGERWVAAFVGPDADTPVAAASMRPLPWPDEAGSVTLEPSPRPRQVWMFVASRTGMQVKRPALGAEGYVLSHYDRGALDRYLEQVGARLLTPFNGRRPFAIFCDSLEVYESDWSPDFLAEFRSRRGYDVAERLPALAADRGLDGAMVREDWGRTLTELLEERFIAPLAAWARARGTRLRMQGYGIPPATISSNANVDLPEGEGPQWRELTASRWASSASHLYGKPVASSETWTWLHSPAFAATPLDLKAEADRHFLQGITQLIGHGWPSTPEGEQYPGWRFYAAGAFNDRNPWWLVMPDVSRYLQRVSAVLRLGTPGNDVALYVPTADAYAQGALGSMHLLELTRERMGREVIGSILDAGFGFDLVDDAAIARHGRIDDKTLSIGAGRYRAVVVPGVEAMPVETLAALDRFAAAGGVVIATRKAPARPPGRTSAESRAAFAAHVQSVFSRSDGGAIVTPDDGAALRRALVDRVPVPIRIVSSGAESAGNADASDPDVGVIERRFGDEAVFFVANTGNVTKRLRVRLGDAGRLIERWDPISEHKEALTADVDGAISLTLAAYQSCLLARTNRKSVAAGASMPIAAADVASSSRVLGPWQVTTGGDRWTLRGAAMTGWDQRDSTRYFSGVATYETTVTLTTEEVSQKRVWLDFGDGTPVAPYPLRTGFRAWLDPPIRDAARVDVNGGAVTGALWSPPYELDITAGVRGGENHVRIRVGNTALNHMAGQSLPNYRLLNLRYGERFVPQDMDQVRTLPSGLTAPIRLSIAK